MKRARFPVLQRLTRTARLLILCRAARSVGQGALVADFALYLHALRWSAAQMGAVYMGGMVLGAGLTLLAGPLSDRIGRKPFILGYGVAQVLAAAMALATTASSWLAAAAVIGAFGRGANGAAGPFGPVEQAWLASDLADGDFGPVYSLNAAVGYGGMAIGALFGALPPFLRGAAPGALDYRVLFVLPLLGALATLALLVPAADPRAPPAPHRDPETGAMTTLDRRERGMLLRLMGINTLNGLGTGLIGPFMALWFHLRFGVGPAAIGPVLAVGFVLASLGSLGTGWLTRRLGMARSIVWMRFAGLVLLVLLPFAPSYGLSATCYVLNAACNRGTSGARQAVGLRLVGASRRGLAASLNTISMQIPRALGPIIGGVLLDAGLLALPMLLTAALQSIYLVLYQRMFRRVG
ncbi:MAG TPA: MFS transporter [Stellaceae bacterium]|nr:MFS transporter [Stellaceae bacterium]